jgi:hypothetical protein
MPRRLIRLLGMFAVGSTAFAQTSTPPDGTILPNMNTIYSVAPVSVKMFGATGDGTTNDLPAIQRAIAYAQSFGSAQHAVYFPCGTYITNRMIDITASPNVGAIRLLGESVSCATIKYTGTSPIEAVVRITSGVDNWSINANVQEMQILGNTHNTHVLELVKPSYLLVNNVNLWGADPATGDCLLITSAVAGTADNVKCSARIIPTITDLPVPKNGIVIDGAGSTLGSVPLNINAPLVQLVGGIGLWLKFAGGVHVAGAQIAGMPQPLNMTSLATNNHITASLFEGGPQQTIPNYLGGSQNIYTAVTFTDLAIGAAYGSEIHGDNNVFIDSYFTSKAPKAFTIVGDATATTVNGLRIGASNTISDLGSGTRIQQKQHTNLGVIDTTDQESEYIPAFFSWNGVSNNSRDGVQKLNSAFSFRSTPTIMSTKPVTAGVSWRAIFIGEWQDYGGTLNTQGMPPFIEITNTSNVVTWAAGETITFTVNGSGLFQGVTNGACCRVFQGTIYFIPNLTPTSGTMAPGPNSMKLAGTLETTGVKIGSNTAPVVVAPTVNRAACIKAAGPPVIIGYCSTVVSAGGACTCN